MHYRLMVIERWILSMQIPGGGERDRVPALGLPRVRVDPPYDHHEVYNNPFVSLLLRSHDGSGNLAASI